MRPQVANDANGLFVAHSALVLQGREPNVGLLRST